MPNLKLNTSQEGNTTSFAQTTVSLSVTDSVVAETWPGQLPNPGNIRVTRTGSTASPLTVWVKLDGTAVRGVEYQFGVAVSSCVIITAGVSIRDLPPAGYGLAPRQLIVARRPGCLHYVLRVPQRVVPPPTNAPAMRWAVEASPDMETRRNASTPWMKARFFYSQLCVVSGQLSVVSCPLAIRTQAQLTTDH